MTENDKINKYQNGKIYTVRSHNHDKYYIGSTCIRLSQRLYTHEKTRRDFMRTGDKSHLTSCNVILEKGNYYIELLENYPCNSKDELHKREGELIRLHKNDLVNINIPKRTMKEWRADNREQYSINRKQQWHSGYGQKQNESRRNTKVKCEVCNREIRKDGISEHEQTKKHLNNLPKENEKITL